MADVSMPYGLRDGLLIHVIDLTEDEHGAAARCICTDVGLTADRVDFDFGGRSALSTRGR